MADESGAGSPPPDRPFDAVVLTSRDAIQGGTLRVRRPPACPVVALVRNEADVAAFLRAGAHDVMWQDQLDGASLRRVLACARVKAQLAHGDAGRSAIGLRDAFLAAVSHELRTPLNAMLGWARMLGCGALAPEHRARAIEAIERNALVQAQLVDDLLDVSRLVSGAIRLDARSVDPTAAIDAAVDAHRPALEAKRITFVREPSHPLGVVVSEPCRLQQIVWHLLANAVKFTPEGGRVTLTTTPSADDLTITIADTGEGIDADARARIFECFERGDDRIVPQHAGLGLGLAIVRHLVRLHGGAVHAESEGWGKGSRFVVRIPRGGVAPSPPRPYDDALAATHVLLVHVGGVLPIEVAGALASARARVTLAASVADAVESMAHAPPDAILASFPIIDDEAVRFIQHVRAHGQRGAHIPAAALTATAGTDDRKRALASGYHMHASLPVAPAELIALVADLAGIAGATAT